MDIFTNLLSPSRKYSAYRESLEHTGLEYKAEVKDSCRTLFCVLPLLCKISVSYFSYLNLVHPPGKKEQDAALLM